MVEVLDQQVDLAGRDTKSFVAGTRQQRCYQKRLRGNSRCNRRTTCFEILRCFPMLLVATLLGVISACTPEQLGWAAPDKASEVQQQADGLPFTREDPARSSLVGANERFVELEQRIERRVSRGDLISSLYFDWMAEPYERATIAVALKTAQVVEREFSLRKRGAGALSDHQLASLIDWLDRTLAETLGGPSGHFAPNRVRVEPADWLHADSFGSPPSALFSFADRSTFTQADTWFGDFDLLACLGFRIYPVGRNRPLAARDVVALRAHAEAIGIGLIDAPLEADERDRPSALAASNARIHPVFLSELIAAPRREGVVPAIIDPPDGESWAGFLGRRALYRGLTGWPFDVAVGAPVPQGRADMEPERIRAAMWVAAIDGQRLGILEGWRDVRDGTMTHYASRFTEPACLEAVAHTALDILRLDDIVRRFRDTPRVIVNVIGNPVDPHDANALAPGVIRTVDQLISEQFAFDLRVTNNNLDAASANDAVSLSMSPKELARQSHALHEQDGRLAAGVLIRSTDNAKGVALVNLLGIERHLVLSSPHAPSGEYIDLLSGFRIHDQVGLGPYQVRLLVPPDDQAVGG